MDLLQLCNIDLKVLISLELNLHGHDILRVPNLSLVRVFEILLKLVQLRPKRLALDLDLGQLLDDVARRVEPVLLDDGLAFRRRQVDDYLALIVSHTAAACLLRLCFGPLLLLCRPLSSVLVVVLRLRLGRWLLGFPRLHFLTLFEILFEPLVVHVQIAHWLLLGSVGSAFEPVDELLVVDFELIFDAFLLVLQVVHRVAHKVLALDLGVVQIQFLQRFLEPLAALVFEPVLQVLHSASRADVALLLTVYAIWPLGLVGSSSGATDAVGSDA